MPEHTNQGLDVSTEEQRFLRRTFLRLALPWVGFLMAFTWWMSPGPPGAGSAEELEALRTELAALSASLERVAEQTTQAERRAAQAVALAGKLEGQRDEGAGQLPALERELRRAADRIAAVEQKLGSQPVSQRFDALSDRIASVEQRMARGSVPAAPAPRALPPAGEGRPLAPLPDEPR